MTYIDITACIFGICPPHRLKMLKQSVDFLSQQNFPFVKKIIVVDEFNGNTMPKKLKKYFENKGWIVLVDSHKSRIKSIDHVFSLVDSEYIFYNEDDVEATLPSIADLTKLFTEIQVKGRSCGMVSLNLGGSTHDFPNDHYGDLNVVKKNILLENNRYLVFRRLEERRSDWFFEFPGLFIRTELFKQSHKIAKKKFPGFQVETGLTKAWFYNKFDKKYFKCSLCRKSILHIVSNNANKIHEQAKFITFIDPYQGILSSGGNSDYAKEIIWIRILKKLLKKLN